jgi:diguanylate cyclase (GGDEF)-like protein
VFLTDNLLLTLRHQTRIVLHITNRDLLKRLASAAMILSICWYSGATTAVFVTAGVILLTEVVARHCSDILPDNDDDLRLPLIFSVWAVNSVSTIAYIWPSVILASQDSIALLLTGFLWMFGLFVHISNSFVALPIYNWSQMIPSFVTGFYVIWRASDAGHAPGPIGEWIVLVAGMGVYVSNTIETLNQQKDTQRALAAARAEAAHRLRALEHMTQHDALTGLRNRHAFDEEVGNILSRRRGEGRVAVFLLDLDGFKPINDTYSHEAGDTVLITIARRLERLVGDNGIAARFGGDEFGVAMPGLASPEAAHRFAAQMIAVVAEPIPWGEKLLRTATSVGICLSGPTQSTVGGLCAAADQAMYRAKSEGVGRAVLYDATAFPPRLTLRDRQTLAEAVASGQIRPHYQPKVDLATGRLFGFEALARWHHPDRGLLSPAHFLPQINELGLQGDFLTAMARHVFMDIESLIADGLDPGQISLNLPEIALATHSGRQDLDRLLSAHRAILSHLIFEITEDVFIARAADMIQDSIARFRLAGLRVSLDDFGTGFASFQHLRQLEFDELKIDPSFVRDLGTDPAATVLVEGFLSIARGLGVTVIAEGVETEEQRQRLLAMGCRHAQGYLFGKAMPLDETRIRLISESPLGTRHPTPPPTPAGASPPPAWPAGSGAPRKGAPYPRRASPHKAAG